MQPLPLDHLGALAARRAMPGAPSSAIDPSRTSTSLGRVEPAARVEHVGAADQQLRRRARARGTAAATLMRPRPPPARLRARAPSPAPREQLVEDRHPHDDARLDLLGDQRLRRVDRVGRQLDAAVDRARMHQQLVRLQPRRVDLVARRVLAQRRHVRFAHALVLHPQHVDDVGLAQAVERRGDVAAERLDPARDQRRRPADGDLGAHPREREDVRARDARVQHVADDPDALAVERAEPAAQRVDVEQRLRRVLVLAVAGVDDGGVGPARDELRGAGVRRADHDRGRVVGRQRLDGVLQRLALRDRRARRADRDDVGGEPLGGQLERAARARRGLVEEVHDRAPAQRGHLLDLASGDLRERRGAVEDPLDPLAVEVVDRQQVSWSVHAVTSAGSGDRHLVDAVELLHAHVDALLAGGREVLADVVGSDRQLAVAAVGQHGELHARGAPVIEDRLDRGAHGAAGVEHVVDDHDRAPFEREAEMRGVDDRRALRAAPRRRGRRRCRCRRAGPRPRSARRRARAGARRAERRAGGCRRSRAAREGFFSTISCAMRTSVRRTSSRSRTTFSASNLNLPGLTGPG